MCLFALGSCPMDWRGERAAFSTPEVVFNDLKNCLLPSAVYRSHKANTHSHKSLVFWLSKEPRVI